MESDIEVDCLSRALAAGAEPRTTLGGLVNEVFAGLPLRDTFRTLFSGELLACSVGWPRRVRAERAADWLREPDVAVELTRSLPSETFTLALTLPGEGATRLCDRLLGAPSSSAMASRSGRPSDAECGVLAYAAARLAAAHGGTWLVRDVRPAAFPAGVDEHLVLWPVAVESTLGPLELTLCLSPSLAEALPDVLLEVVLHDLLPPAHAQPTLAVGEVWVSDQLPLTNTSEGLTGPVTLRAVGSEHQARARLGAHYVQLRAPDAPLSGAPCSASPGAQGFPVELVIARRTLRFSALAALASGARCFVGELGQEPVLLRRAGTTLASGELISWRAALGVRVTQT